MVIDYNNEMTSLLDKLSQDANEVAPWLLGMKLIHQSPFGLISGYIVETEAYMMDDPASHSFNGKTVRNAPLFDRAGTLYVYFTYGMHFCFNIVTGEIGQGQAVLIRAVQPVDGIEIMQSLRSQRNIFNLANGPGKLTQAFSINKVSHNGRFLLDSNIRLEKGRKSKVSEIITTPRIGISKASDVAWRFFIKDNMYISGKSTRGMK
ncbi:MAG: DNA-3-methyladenine glycosylase [Candidatus Saccharimonadales bacterium]